MPNIFCIKCGAPINEGAKFCAACGAPQAQQAPAQNIPAQPPQGAPVSQPAFTQGQYGQQPYGSQPYAQPLQQPPQQYPQGAPAYPGAYAKPVKKRRVPLFLIILIVVVVLVAIAITAAILIGSNTLSKAGDADYYEIGTDKVPSIKLALGVSEDRKLDGVSTSLSGDEVKKVYKYHAGNAKDGLELYDYATYLQDDGFMFLTDASFSKSTGAEIQMGRNSVAEGYMVIIQFDWNPGEYIITLTRSRGTVTANS